MYTVRNFRTKKALKEAVAAWKAYCDATVVYGADQPTVLPVRYYQPGPFGGNEPKDGTFCVEGPHYPEPHKWYATCEAKDGVIVKVK